ncbi:MAG TPA: polysaccharide pyruvyl transferase family protein [Steroidobacteraceae bacterium]|jgi:polysaccharide pyruvyl transferase WcaK-like protein|nr:polysaccharide pyruvyl transferase family protein [Steroidobacteraceae bacterium]
MQFVAQPLIDSGFESGAEPAYIDTIADRSTVEAAPVKAIADSSRYVDLEKMISRRSTAVLKIAVLDTSVTSMNLGDEIIMDASRKVLRELFPNAFFVTLPTHEFFLWESYRVLKDCDYVFVGGSNLLKSKMMWHNQWKISPFDLFLRRDCILLGCGWWHYQSPADWYSRQLLKRILSSRYQHSVRDEYSRQQLISARVGNVINTACVTMWDLNAAHCALIPKRRAPRAITTLTGYNANPAADKAVIDTLLKHYQEVVLWVQQPEDFAYGVALSGGRVKFIAPNLNAFTTFMRDNDVDYVGSRLHGGIRALQMGKRTLILAVDNRAVEISRDTNLPVALREDIGAITHWINVPFETKIQLPQQAIDRWKQQFIQQDVEAIKAAG